MIRIYFGRGTKPVETGQSPLILDQVNERYLLYSMLLHSEEATAQRIRNDLQKIADTQGDTLDNVMSNVIMYNIQYWQIDTSAKPSDILRKMYSNIRFSIGKRSTASVPLTDSGTIVVNGEEIELENTRVNFGLNMELDEISSLYRQLLNCVDYVSDKIGRGSRDGFNIRLLYCKWLHMINKDENFLNADMLRGEYRNNKKPNEIINKYSTQDGKPANELIDEYTEEYLDTTFSRKVSVNEYYKYMYILLRYILGYEILTPGRRYFDSEIDEEIEEIRKPLPDVKFSQNYLEKTINVKQWNELGIDEILNEYNIEAFADKLILGNGVPELKPLISAPNRNLDKTESYMQYLNLKSKLLGGHISTLYERTYVGRLAKLQASKETHRKYKRIQNLEKLNNKTIKSDDSYSGIDTSMLERRLREFRIDNPDLDKAPDTEDIIKDINKTILSTINMISNNLYETYKNTDWNLREMNGLFANIELTKEIQRTLHIKNGIYYLLNKPLLLKSIKTFVPGIEEEDAKMIETGFYVTDDGLLIGGNFIIKPRYGIGQKSSGQTTYSVGKFEAL